MPFEFSKKLQNNRNELDQHELSEGNLINAENAYLEMVDIFDFVKIECVKDNNIRTIEEISEDIYNSIKDKL